MKEEEEGEWSKVVRRRQNVRNEGCSRRQKPDVAVGSTCRQDDNPITFFFTNFPKDFGAKEMLKIFQHYGKFSEVVIPTKRNKNGRRFGFARALEVEDPRSFVAKLDNIFIGCDKIFVNIPKYERNALIGGTKGAETWPQTRSLTRQTDQASQEDNSEGSKELKMQHKDGGQATRQHAEIQTWSVSPSGSDTNEVRKVQIHSSEHAAPLHFQVENETIIKLNKCFVGKVRFSGLSYIMQDEFHRKGFSSIKATPLGSNKVLLEGEDEDDVPKMINDAYEWIGNRFEEIRSWRTSEVDDERHVWLRCSGVPVHAWSDKFFKFLSSRFGDFLHVDDNTHSKKVMDMARIKIKSNHLEPVNTTLRIFINGEPFLIKVVEECSGLVQWAMQKGLNQATSTTGVSDGDGGAFPLREDKKPAPLDCENSALGGEIKDSNNEKIGVNSGSVHADLSVEYEDSNNDELVEISGSEKVGVQRVERERSSKSVEMKEREGVADKENIEIHVEDTNCLCKGMGINTVAHKQAVVPFADVDCNMGQQNYMIKEKVGLSKGGANRKSTANAPQFSADPDSNKILNIAASHNHVGSSGILNFNNFQQNNCKDLVGKKISSNGMVFGGVSEKYSEYYLNKKKVMDIRGRSVKAQKVKKKLAE